MSPVPISSETAPAMPPAASARPDAAARAARPSLLGPADTLPGAPATRAERWLRTGIWVFVGTIVFSVLGTLWVQSFPETLPWFAAIGLPYERLVKGPTWTFMTLLPILPILAYWSTTPHRRLLFFALWGTLIGGLSEVVGTLTGLPFGIYSYTDWLGPKLFGHVPFFIPPSWFAMSILSLDLAQRLTASRLRQVLLVAFFMVLWDVSLDPAMSRAFPFWHYPGAEAYAHLNLPAPILWLATTQYYGMPMSNWIGWFVVSAIIAAGYVYLGGGLARASRYAPLVYTLNGLFPVLIAALYANQYGLWPGVGVGIVATLVPLAMLRAKGLPLWGPSDPPVAAPPPVAADATAEVR